MMSTELPLNALPPPAVALVETVGVAVVLVDTDGCGSPSENGLLAVVCALATAGQTSAIETTAARTTRVDLTLAPDAL